LIKLIAFVFNLCFPLVLMFICFVKYSSEINLDLFWKQLFSYNRPRVKIIFRDGIHQVVLQVKE
jgi:hypothetical protein